MRVGNSFSGIPSCHPPSNSLDRTVNATSTGPAANSSDYQADLVLGFGPSRGVIIKADKDFIVYRPSCYETQGRENANAIRKFCATHEATTLEIATCYTLLPDRIRGGKICALIITAWFGLALRIPYTPDVPETLKNFRAVPTYIVKRGRWLEPYWHFAIYHDTQMSKNADAPSLAVCSPDEYQHIRRGLALELEVTPEGDGHWSFLPRPTK